MKKKILVLAVIGICAAICSVAFAKKANKKAKAGKEELTLNKKEVSFESESGSLIMQNDTEQDVVVFLGKVEKEALLGGIRRRETRSFDLSKIKGIPSNGQVLIRVASYETYNGKARLTEEDVIYSGLVVYDLKDLKFKQQINIYAGIDFDHKTCFYASNLSENFVLELREGNATGPVIATLAPLQETKAVFLAEKPDGEPYNIYPEYIYIDPKTKEQASIVGGKKDRMWANVEPYPQREKNVLTFEEPSTDSITFNTAYLTIQNDSRSGIKLWNGSRTLANQRGRTMSDSGRSNTYELSCPDGDTLFTGLNLEFQNTTKIKIDDFTAKPGTVYTLLITEKDGNYAYDIKEKGKKDIVKNARIDLFGED